MEDMALNEKGLDFYGTSLGWPDNVIITYSRKLGYAGGMNEKGYILVNLGQI